MAQSGTIWNNVAQVADELAEDVQDPDMPQIHLKTPNSGDGSCAV